MPEGHTIHRAAKDQRPMLKGHVVQVSSPQGRFLESAEEVDGQVCLSVEAYGKHLLYEFANGLTLHIHLGLFGKFKSHKRPACEPVGAVRVRMESPTHIIDINGPNTCELLNPDERSALINRIGPDVLRKDANASRAFSRISKSKAPIGLLLMDQSVIAGIGNIYRTEILWRCQVNPLTPGRLIDRSTFDMLWDDAAALLELGVKHNAIITVNGVSKSKSHYGERVNIFNKPHCPKCSSEINRIEMAARRAFYCGTCQPITSAASRPPLPPCRDFQ
jgi:endonuclease VIII